MVLPGRGGGKGKKRALCDWLYLSEWRDGRRERFGSSSEVSGPEVGKLVLDEGEWGREVQGDFFIGSRRFPRLAWFGTFSMTEIVKP